MKYFQGIPPGVRRPRRHRAMWFDGVDDGVIVPTSIPYPSNGTSIGIRLMQLETPTAYYPSLVMLILPTGQQFILQIKGNTNSILFGVQPIGFGVSIIQVSISAPLYIPISIIAQWATGTKLVVFVDGMKHQSNFIISGSLSSCNQLIIGRTQGPNNTADEILEECTIFPRLLSDEEGLSLSLGNLPPGCLGYWKGTGVDLSDWKDFSGNGYDATAITGNPIPAYIRRDGIIIKNGVRMN